MKRAQIDASEIQVGEIIGAGVFGEVCVRPRGMQLGALDVRLLSTSGEGAEEPGGGGG